MGKSKMAFMETRDGMEDMKEYFQWIKEEEWKQYVDAMEEEFHRKYGHQLMFRIEWGKWLRKNNMI